MQDEIKKLIESQTLCEIYSNADDTNNFGVGYFLACDEEDCIVWHIDKYGKYDGMAYKPIELIDRIQTDTIYLRDIETLMRHNGVSLDITLKPSQTVLINFLKQIHSEQRICCMELYESDCDDIIGRIDEVDEDSKLVKLSLVDVHGQNDGKAVVDVDTISEVYYQTRYTTKIEILNEVKK